MPDPEAAVRMSAWTPASVEQVWRCLADPLSYARWVAGTAAIVDVDSRWPEVGSRLFHRFGPRPLRSHDHTTVLESEPPHRIVLSASARPFGVVRATVTVVPEGSGAWVELCEQAVGGLAARWPSIGRRIQRLRNRRSLRCLLALAEQRSA